MNADRPSLTAMRVAAVPPSASFVAVDFERQSWLEPLQQAGFRADAGCWRRAATSTSRTWARKH